MKIKRWISLSLGLHLFLFLMFSYFQRNSESTPSPDLAQAPVSFEVLQPMKKGPSSVPDIKNLLPKSLGFKPRKFDPLGISAEPKPIGDPDGLDTEVPAFSAPIQTLGDAIDLDSFYAELWRSLAATLTYPEDFSRQRISGTVTLRMEVDFRGMITGRKIYADSENKFLEALALYSVTATLSKPLQAKYWLDRKTVPVTVRINYWPRLPDDTRQQNPGGVVGHHLEISKYDYIKPELQEKIEKYMVVIPVPGGFYVDFIKIYMLIKESLEPNKDDLRAFRVKNLQETMKRHLEKMPAQRDSIPAKRKPLDQGADFGNFFVPVS